MRKYTLDYSNKWHIFQKCASAITANEKKEARSSNNKAIQFLLFFLFLSFLSIK
jgi:hypothetical protein